MQILQLGVHLLGLVENEVAQDVNRVLLRNLLLLEDLCNYYNLLP